MSDITIEGALIANASENTFKEYIVSGKNGWLCHLDIHKWKEKILKISYLKKSNIKNYKKNLFYKEFDENFYKIIKYFSKLNEKKQLDIKEIL